MNEDIPIGSVVLLKVIAVVQVMFGLLLTFVGSYFMAGVPHFTFLIFICGGLFIVYAGVQSLRGRLSVFNWILSCVLLTAYGALYTYSNFPVPLFVLFGSSVVILGMVGVKSRGKYEKYQLRKSLKTPSKTQ